MRLLLLLCTVDELLHTTKERCAATGWFYEEISTGWKIIAESIPYRVICIAYNNLSWPSLLGVSRAFPTGNDRSGGEDHKGLGFVDECQSISS